MSDIVHDKIAEALRELISAVESSSPKVRHTTMGGRPVNILAPEEAELFRCCLNGQDALAKLEEK